MPYKLVSRQQWLELLFGYINSITCAHGITTWGQDNVIKSLHLVLHPPQHLTPNAQHPTPDTTFVRQAAMSRIQ